MTLRNKQKVVCMKIDARFLNKRKRYDLHQSKKGLNNQTRNISQSRTQPLLIGKANSVR